MIDQAAELFEKSPDTLLNISKKAWQCYRSFRKKFAKVPER